MSEDPDAKPKSRTWYRVCATLGVIGGTITLCSGFFFVISPIVQDSAARMSSTSNMKQIGLAVHNYHYALDTMPGPFLDDTVDRSVRVPDMPSARLSWRVTILPYLESDPTYKQINKSEAWNGPNNGPLLNRHWRTFADPVDGKTSFTPYRVFHDNGALWDSDPKRRVALDKIPDGAANTVLIAESTVQVPWAQFNEHRFDPDGPLPELGRASRNTFLLAMADGSVRTVKKGVDPNILRAAVTRDGNEPLGFDR